MRPREYARVLIAQHVAEAMRRFLVTDLYEGNTVAYKRRQLPAIKRAAGEIAPVGGWLALDPDFELPAYARKVDIHVMPGSFHTALADDDRYAGAMYDRGVYLYAYGGLGTHNDGLGRATTDFVKSRFPDLKPRRILDMGCGTGMSTHPLAAMWPDAEIYAIDIAADAALRAWPVGGDGGAGPLRRGSPRSCSATAVPIACRRRRYSR